MPDKDKNTPVVQGLSAENVLRLLDPLKSDPGGSVIYRHVSHVVREMERTQNKVSRGYAVVLHNLLAVLRKQLPGDSLLNLELKMVQKRLMPPITLAELAALQVYLQKAIRLATEVADPDADLLREAFAPLIGATATGPHTAPHRPATEPEPRPAARPQPAGGEVDTGGEEAELEPMESQAGITLGELNLDSQAEIPVPAAAEEAAVPAIPAGFQKRLSKQTQQLHDLQETLTARILETIQHQEKFGLLLEETLYQLERAENKEDVENVRQHAISEINHILAEQNEVVRMLSETEAFLHLIRRNSHELSQELDHVRTLSLTDDLTQLPNRRAFLQRLDDEIDRSRRYQYPLTIALLDLDEFKQINDSHGHAVGDKVLKQYASDILSQFRRHDLVARYGGEEFAILFPNTSLDEALRALEKARQQAMDSRLALPDETIPIPTFSAGLTSCLYTDNSEALLGRADALLYTAKKNGRNRIEMDNPSTAGEQVLGN